jgi:carbon storage regulator
MLILSRKRNERIFIGPNIIVTVVEIRGDKVRIGVEAPTTLAVHREEIAERIAAGVPQTGGAETVGENGGM